MESAPAGTGGDAAAEGRVTDGMAEGDPADGTVGGTEVEGIVEGTLTGGAAPDMGGAVIGAGAKAGAVSSGMVADPWAEAGVSGETRIRLGKIR